MNKRDRRRAVLLVGLVSLTLAGAFGLSMRSYLHQETLNRQLIAALVKRDTQQALFLVNAGADPNTPATSVSSPSLRRLWDYLLHHSPMQVRGYDTAFSFAVNGWRRLGEVVPDGVLPGPDAPELVEAMLQHGANILWKDAHGVTPLIGAIEAGHDDTVLVLLKYRADVNPPYSRDTVHPSALSEAVEFSQHSGDIMTRVVIPQLLARGADPNLPVSESFTPLHIARQKNRSDLVVLLQKGGAKQ